MKFFNNLYNWFFGNKKQKVKNVIKKPCKVILNYDMFMDYKNPICTYRSQYTVKNEPEPVNAEVLDIWEKLTFPNDPSIRMPEVDEVKYSILEEDDLAESILDLKQTVNLDYEITESDYKSWSDTLDTIEKVDLTKARDKWICHIKPTQQELDSLGSEGTSFQLDKRTFIEF